MDPGSCSQNNDIVQVFYWGLFLLPGLLELNKEH